MMIFTYIHTFTGLHLHTYIQYIQCIHTYTVHTYIHKYTRLSKDIKLTRLSKDTVDRLSLSWVYMGGAVIT